MKILIKEKVRSGSGRQILNLRVNLRPLVAPTIILTFSGTGRSQNNVNSHHSVILQAFSNGAVFEVVIAWHTITHAGIVCLSRVE